MEDQIQKTQQACAKVTTAEATAKTFGPLTFWFPFIRLGSGFQHEWNNMRIVKQKKLGFGACKSETSPHTLSWLLVSQECAEDADEVILRPGCEGLIWCDGIAVQRQGSLVSFPVKMFGVAFKKEG